MKNIVFWLEFPLFHVAPLIERISQEPSVRVFVVCEKEIPKWRLDMGFPTPDFGKANVFFSPTSKDRREIVNMSRDKDWAHVFYGLRSSPLNFQCFSYVTKESCIVGLYMEALRLHEMPMGIFRALYYKFFFAIFKRKIDFVLALGDMGVRQYSSLGVSKEKLFGFKYYLNFDGLEKGKFMPATHVRFLYVGQLVDRKNVMLLLEAFKNIKKSFKNVSLTLVGEGVRRNDIVEFVDKGNLADAVSLFPYFNNNELSAIYECHDVLVLPSEFDGWGVVTVEAMMHGLCVAVSDGCGSSSIIKSDSHGIVFKRNSLSDLQRAMTLLTVNNLHLSEESRLKRQRYARGELSANAGKNTLLNIIYGDKFQGKL